ncbi:hypothetical protein KUTeg_000194 [Tegillarca granosa]|uniref:Major facilitator superfamily (MFS) profile domain-containing protein n=1 Tax=Tegillarca granosa TaxID=220873 RepID=A0ABQ9FWV0_TEGGR|nr:hypothetical protein KUTeg_000194 [Tegillarca granosa]
MLFFGVFYTFAIRVNINLSIVCMVNHSAITDINSTDESHCNKNDSGDIDGPFVWNRNVQANILGAYFWPYAISQVPASLLVTKFGAHRVFGCVLLLTAVITILTPVVSRVNYIGTITLRAFIGILTAGTFVSCQYLLGRWIPIQERSRMSALTFAGIEIGSLVTYALTGVLCDHGFDGGWPSIFYIQDTKRGGNNSSIYPTLRGRRLEQEQKNHAMEEL